MPAMIARSISILSDAGLGMAMFSLGLLNYKPVSGFLSFCTWTNQKEIS